MEIERPVGPKIRVAVVGIGYWGKNLVRNFHELGALEALCDTERSVAAACNNSYAGVRFSSEFREVLSDSSIDAVALATPAITHYGMVKAALEAGKDVFVEKPLAIDVQQGEGLVQLAAAKQRILMVGHILRYHPAILGLQELIRDGALGKINYLYSNRLSTSGKYARKRIFSGVSPRMIFP